MKKKVKSEYQSCAYCVHRSKCWNSASYSDRGGCGKKPYPRNCKCETQFSFDKSIGGY